MRRVLALAFLGVAASLLWASTAMGQPGQPEFRLYGESEAGDVVSVHDEDGAALGATAASADGGWYLDVSRDRDNVGQVSFQLNGEPVSAELTLTGEDQALVRLSAPMASSAGSDLMSEDDMQDDALVSDAMSEDDDMASDDAMSDELTSEDAMSDDAMQDDAMSDESMSDEGASEAYPVSGTGGLAEDKPSPAALIGVLVVLGTLALSMGVWRLRRQT